MSKGDKFSNNRQNTGFGREKVRDFMRKDFQLEESIRFNRAKADKNQKIRIQGLRSDFQAYHQQIESVIKNVIETLPAQAKMPLSNAMQAYKKLKDDFSDVISFTHSDQTATKLSDYLSLRLPSLESSVRNAKEERLNDAVNQIRPLHQKLMYLLVLVKFSEEIKSQDNISQEPVRRQSFEQDDSQQTTVRRQSFEQDDSQQTTVRRQSFEQDDSQQTTVRRQSFEQDDSQQTIVRRQSFEQDDHPHAQESEKQKSTIREMVIKMQESMRDLYTKYYQYSQMKGIFLNDEKYEVFAHIRENFYAYKKIFDYNSKNFSKLEASDLLNAYATLSDKHRDISEDIEHLETIKNHKVQSDILERSIREWQRDVARYKLLERAKPVLSPEAEEAFHELSALHSQIKHEISIPNIDEKHREAFEKLLGYLSPDTLEEFKRHDVKFVVDLNAKVFYPTIEKGENDQWQIKIYMPYPYGIHGLMLRTIDLQLEIHQKQYGRIPSPELRAEVAARAFRANERMGKEGFHREGYEMAEKYYNDYKTGIYQALEQNRIDINTPKEVLEEIGYKYALQEYLESAKPKEDIPVFPGMQPGAYFEESRIWELNEGQRPVEVGSEAFHQVMQKLNTRRLEGNNFTLTVNILPPDTNSSDGKTKILVQPFYAIEGLRSHHPINAGGKHTLWAGEIDIDYNPETRTGTVLRIKDQSGHFRTFVQDKPNLMIDYALNEFQLRGYDTSSTVKQLTFVVGATEVPFKNYRPLIDPGQNMETIEATTAEQARQGIFPEMLFPDLQIGMTEE